MKSMNTLKEFIESRIPKLGFRGTMQFLRKTGITWPTFELAVTDPERSRSGTRELLADSLRFMDWNDLADAWSAGDIRRHLPESRFSGPPVRLTPPTEMEVKNALEQLADANPEVVRGVIGELDESVLESIREMFLAGQQGAGKQSRQAAKPKQS